MYRNQELSNRRFGAKRKARPSMITKCETIVDLSKICAYGLFKKSKNDDFLVSNIFIFKYFEIPSITQNSEKTDPWTIIGAFKKISCQTSKMIRCVVRTATVAKNRKTTFLRHLPFLNLNILRIPHSIKIPKRRIHRQSLELSKKCYIKGQK